MQLERQLLWRRHQHLPCHRRHPKRRRRGRFLHGHHSRRHRLLHLQIVKTRRRLRLHYRRRHHYPQCLRSRMHLLPHRSPPHHQLRKPSNRPPLHSRHCRLYRHCRHCPCPARLHRHLQSHHYQHWRKHIVGRRQLIRHRHRLRHCPRFRFLTRLPLLHQAQQSLGGSQKSSFLEKARCHRAHHSPHPRQSHSLPQPDQPLRRRPNHRHHHFPRSGR